MTICNNCGHENVEGNKFCAECGTKLFELDEDNQEDMELENEQNTEENRELVEEMTFTADKVESVPKQINKKKIIIAIVTLVIIFGCFLGYQKYAEAQYENKMKEAVTKTLEQSAKCESMINTFSSVWHDTIFENDYFWPTINGQKPTDFNSAIRLQVAEFKGNGQYEEIKNGKIKVDKMMSELKNPPKKYLAEYNLIVEMYTTYCEYESLAESPQGSLQTFNNNASDLSSQIVKKINEFKVRIPLQINN